MWANTSFVYNKVLKNSVGSTLISAVMTLSMTSLVVFYYSHSVLSIKRKSAEIKNQVVISNLRSSILQVLKNQYSWKNTIESSLNNFDNCKNDLSTCVGSKEFIPLNLFDPNNNIYLNGDVSYNKFNRRGERCDQNADCPYYVGINWRPICFNSDGECTQVALNLDIYDRNKKSISEIKLFKNLYLGTYSGTSLPSAALQPGQKEYNKDITLPMASADQVKVKVFIILDSSKSMADNMEKVRLALEDLLLNLNQNDVQVYFYSTASGALFFNNWRYEAWLYNTLIADPSHNFQNHPNISVYNFTQTVNSSSLDEYDISLKDDFSAQLGLPITSDLSASEISTRLNTILSKYQYDPIAGSNAESGLCALSRILMEDGPTKVLEPGDQPHFIIISDEDETALVPTFWNGTPDCVKNVKIEKTSTVHEFIGSTPCDKNTEDCTSATISFRSKGIQALVVFDLKSGIESTNITKIYTICSPNTTGASCKYPTVGTFPCDVDDAALYTGTDTVLGCKVAVSESFGSIYSRKMLPEENTQPSLRPYQHLSNCLTDTFYVSGVAYAGAKDYVDKNLPVLFQETFYNCNYVFLKEKVTYITFYDNDIRFQLVDGNDLGGQFDLTRVESFNNTIADTLNNRYGELGYSVSFYIHDQIKDNGMCVPESVDQYGVRYSNFESKLNALSSINSICNSQYTSHFQTLANNIQTSLNNTISFIEFDPTTEQITGVELYRGGVSIFLDPAAYSISGPTVIFQEDILQDGDSIRIITSPI